MNKINPLKRYGQHYLIDNNIIKKIIDEINPNADDTLIEIGPGLGAITNVLYNKVKNFYAVEIDKGASEKLKETLPGINLIHKDFLKINLSDFKKDKRKIRIAGNIPYNLTSPIIFKLIDNIRLIEDAVLMVQYEVAKRMTAKKSTKDYGILAVLLNYFAKTEVCFKISPNVFFPKPKVNSALVHMYLKNIEISEIEKRLFIKIVKAAFGKRRKTLKNSLSSSIFNNYDFSDSGVDLSLRAENLSVDDFLMLAEAAKNQTGNTVLPI